MARFDGLTVLITGATGGFGRRSAERFAAEGTRLVLSDIGETALAGLAADYGEKAAYLAGDVADETLHANLVKLAVDRFGSLDIALNNAGIVHDFARLAQIGSDQARRVMDVDLLAVFFALKHQLGVMERQYKTTGRNAAIVNISSAAGLNGAPKMAIYAAAKHGVIGLTKTAAVEYATRGVRVNAVCPSYARTAMAATFVEISGQPEDVAYAEMTRGVPMKRLAEVDEVVEAILFAANPANSFMTGHCLAVDGGIGAI